MWHYTEEMAIYGIHLQVRRKKALFIYKTINKNVCSFVTRTFALKHTFSCYLLCIKLCSMSSPSFHGICINNSTLFFVLIF